MTSRLLKLLIFLWLVFPAAAALAQLSVGAAPGATPGLADVEEVRRLAGRLADALGEPLGVRLFETREQIGQWLNQHAMLDLGIVDRQYLLNNPGKFLPLGALDESGQMLVVTSSRGPGDLPQRVRTALGSGTRGSGTAPPVVAEPVKAGPAKAGSVSPLLLGVVRTPRGTPYTEEEAAGLAALVSERLGVPVQGRVFASDQVLADWFLRYRMVDLALIVEAGRGDVLGHNYQPLWRLASAAAVAGAPDLLAARLDIPRGQMDKLVAAANAGPMNIDRRPEAPPVMVVTPAAPVEPPAVTPPPVVAPPAPAPVPEPPPVVVAPVPPVEPPVVTPPPPVIEPPAPAPVPEPPPVAVAPVPPVEPPVAAAAPPVVEPPAMAPELPFQPVPPRAVEEAASVPTQSVERPAPVAAASPPPAPAAKPPAPPEEEPAPVLAGTPAVPSVIAQPALPQELRPPGLPTPRPTRTPKGAQEPPAEEPLRLAKLPDKVGRTPKQPPLMPEADPDPGVIYVVPFQALMVPAEVHERIFDQFVDVLNERGAAQGLKFVILKQGLERVSPEWLAARKHVQGEVFGYVEESGCCSTDLRTKARLTYYRANQPEPSFKFEYPIRKMFEHDQSTLPVERQKLADQVAEVLIEEMLRALQP